MSYKENHNGLLHFSVDAETDSSGNFDSESEVDSISVKVGKVTPNRK